ncbi:hypothetical protein HETIRDRAFT_439429 [Heterobasidion irregulare TC 32-1]|uniref:Uncharacterized protein n=1 Tax=Heterobasidion irregulare (strain TC 32-1) TaxID=747525 RepID=W4KBU9_HETIT|nr:uncharacterized protein HETIRDRAFT_439429 [Heterobasidion irregulare TC 32-1]ETW82551.1 hypothetical protein HETIRDRAFT_439429 [Heterobasidion irregulare TC 32-1]
MAVRGKGKYHPLSGADVGAGAGTDAGTQHHQLRLAERGRRMSAPGTVGSGVGAFGLELGLGLSMPMPMSGASLRRGAGAGAGVGTGGVGERGERGESRA